MLKGSAKGVPSENCNLDVLSPIDAILYAGTKK
jgi:hypothetical protein